MARFEFVLVISMVVAMLIAQALLGGEHRFTQGVGGYAGARDNWIDGVPGHNDPGNGRKPLLAARVGNRTSNAADHSVGEMYNVLIAFDHLQLPEGEKIRSASLTLHVVALGADLDDNEPAVLEAFELVRPWDEQTSNWARAKPGEPWGDAGARKTDTDRGSLRLGFTAVGAVKPGDTVEIELPPELIQVWIENAPGHHGLLLRMADEPYDSLQINFASSEATDPAHRPTLKIKTVE